MVFHTAAQIAKIRNISVDEILKSNRDNIRRCYNIKNQACIQSSDIIEDNTSQNITSVLFENKVEWIDWSEDWGTDVLQEECDILKAKSV